MCPNKSEIRTVQRWETRRNGIATRGSRRNSARAHRMDFARQQGGRGRGTFFRHYMPLLGVRRSNLMAQIRNIVRKRATSTPNAATICIKQKRSDSSEQQARRKTRPTLGGCHPDIPNKRYIRTPVSIWRGRTSGISRCRSAEARWALLRNHKQISGVRKMA